MGCSFFLNSTYGLTEVLTLKVLFQGWMDAKKERTENNIFHSLSSSLLLEGNSYSNNPISADVLNGAHVFSIQGAHSKHVSLEITS